MQHASPISESSTDLYGLPAADTNITDLILSSCAEDPRASVYAVRNGAGAWLDVRFDAFLGQVRDVAKGLIAHGLQPGQRVALFAPTCYEWAVLDQAVWFAGAVSVPIYETSSAAQVAHILGDSQTHAAAVGGDELAATTREAARQAGIDVTVFPMSEAALRVLARDGAAVTDEQLEAARTTATLDDAASVVYTSGTTGRPKGAIITHRNFAAASINVLNFAAGVVDYHPGTNSRTLLFLPLAHVLAHAVQVICLYARIQMAHSGSTKTLQEDMASFHPTWLLAVPRVFEKLEAGIAAKAEDGGRGPVYHAAKRTAIEYSEALEAQTHEGGPGPSRALRARHAVFDTLVYGNVRKAFGGEVLSCVSGASALSPELVHLFRGMGIPIVEGYGLTETTAPATVNIPAAYKVGTVGLPVAGATIRIADDGEVLVKGPIVFAGYLRQPEATAESMDGDFFRTGDLGTLDEDGFLRITGRKKEVIVTAGGKNVYPTPLEEIIRQHRLVQHVVVVGDDRPYVGALIVLDPDELKRWSLDRERTLTLEEAVADEGVLAALQEAVDQANATVSRAESIRRIRVLDHELTEDSGHVTQSQKLKRAQVLADYADEIEQLYRGR